MLISSSIRHLPRKVTMVNLFSKHVYVISPQLLSFSTNCRNNSQSQSKVIEPEPQTSSPPNSKTLKVAIIGVPNAGKSTLINRLMEFDVCPVSKKAHTTRANQRAIFLEDETQVIFIDTPGVANKKETERFGLTKEFLQGPEDSVRDADLIAVLHSVENKILKNKLDVRLINVLQKFPTKPSILIINKVDILKVKRKLLETVKFLTEGMVDGTAIPIKKEKRIKPKLKPETLFDKSKVLIGKAEELTPRPLPEPNDEEDLSDPTPALKKIEIDRNRVDENGRVVRGWPHFRDVFMISAIDGDGVDMVKDYFKRNAVKAPWEYAEDVLTDVPPAELCLRVVKSAMLQVLKQEIPYIINPRLEYWDTNDAGVLRIIIGLDTPNERIHKVVIGYQGSALAAMKVATEKALSQLLHCEVSLHFNVQLKIPPKQISQAKQDYLHYKKKQEEAKAATTNNNNTVHPQDLM